MAYSDRHGAAFDEHDRRVTAAMDRADAERRRRVAMRCDLAGLLANAARAIRRGDRSATVTAFGLEEAVKHVEMLRKGEATLQEFCDHYCLPFSEPPCPHPPDKRVTYGGGVAAPLGRESDTVWCDECGEQVP